MTGFLAAGITNRWTRAAGREFIADFQLPIVDLIRAAASTQTFGIYLVVHRATSRPMKRIKITNDRANFVTLWLEPWGADYGMAPAAEFDIVAGDAGEDFYFHVLSDDKGFKVYAEGQVTEIGVFQNGAELSCGHARREETW